MSKKPPRFQIGDKVDFFTMPWKNTECVIESAYYHDDPWGEGNAGWFYGVKFENGFIYSPAWESSLKPIVE